MTCVIPWGLLFADCVSGCYAICVSPSLGAAPCRSHSLEPSPCVFPYKAHPVLLIGLSPNAVISASTVITSWVTVQVVTSVLGIGVGWGGVVLTLRRQLTFSLVTGFLPFPTNIYRTFIAFIVFHPRNILIIYIYIPKNFTQFIFFL